VNSRIPCFREFGREFFREEISDGATRKNTGDRQSMTESAREYGLTDFVQPAFPRLTDSQNGERICLTSRCFCFDNCDGNNGGDGESSGVASSLSPRRNPIQG
jgi:hypothetical protein